METFTKEERQLISEYVAEAMRKGLTAEEIADNSNFIAYIDARIKAIQEVDINELASKVYDLIKGS